jgi:hypothetical protein
VGDGGVGHRIPKILWWSQAFSIKGTETFDSHNKQGVSCNTRLLVYFSWSKYTSCTGIRLRIISLTKHKSSNMSQWTSITSSFFCCHEYIVCKVLLKSKTTGGVFCASQKVSVIFRLRICRLQLCIALVLLQWRHTKIVGGKISGKYRYHNLKLQEKT